MKVIDETREIGPVGTIARVIVGAGFIVAAVFVGATLPAIVIGAVVIPGAVTGAMLLRGLRARPLRAHEPHWHCVNLTIAAALFVTIPAAAFLFYGASMLIAAWRGFGACELLASSNLILRRKDQMACPVFLPIDAAEARATGRDLYR